MRHLIQSTPYFTNWTDLIACFDSGFILGKLVRFSHGIRIFAILFEEPCSMKFLDCLLSAPLHQLIEITVESQKNTWSTLFAKLITSTRFYIVKQNEENW